MKVQTRRKVSYVIRQPNGRKAHCLGVNSLAIDTKAVYNMDDDAGQGGLLYSAGRDGVVAGWQLHIPLRQQRSLDTSSTWAHDRELKSTLPATCEVFSQMHTDWVNDIVVCDQGTSIVSASADRTIKLWNPYSEDSHQSHTIGWHTDYVKCLAYAPEPGWVASGGLDKRINIWDLTKGEATLTIQAGSMNINNDHPGDTSNTSHGSASKSSIYAMAVNPSGTLLVTGSPEKVVRIWDPRSGKRVSKLTGHTDNIRALLISHDGQHVLSGSSDSTIKLWSVTAQRCLTTYETHTDSVWSLFSDHPDLKTFYAGSRDGLVSKTEIPREGATDKHDESECIGLFKESSGVGKIVAFDDTYIWTATSSSSINRWLSVPSRESRQVLTRSEYNPDIPPSAIVKLPATQAVFSPQMTEHFLANDSLTLYAGSVMSIPMSYNDDDESSVESLTPLREHPDQTIEGNPGITAHLVLQNRQHVLVKDTSGEVTLWDIVRCLEVKRFGQRNLDEVAQEISGIESFPSWCSVTTKIGAITVQLLESNCFDCEMYADEIGLSDDYQYREDQRVNLGKWLLANLFSSFITAEMQRYKSGVMTDYDSKEAEAMHQQKFTGHHASDDSQGTKSSTQSSVRYEGSEAVASVPVIQQDTAILTPPLTALKIPLTAVTTNTESSPFYPGSSENQHHQPSTGIPNYPAVNTNGGGSNSMISQNGPMTAPPTTGRTFDYFSGSHHPVQHHSSVQPPPPVALSSSPVSPSSSNFMHRLKNLSVKGKLTKGTITDDKSDGYTTEEDKQSFMTSATANGESSSTTSKTDLLNGKKESNTSSTEEKQQQQVTSNSISNNVNGDGMANERYTPPNLNDFPPLNIPFSTSIIIAEESPEASTSMDLYRGEAGCLGEDHALISKVAPSWLLAFLLYNKTPNKETVKLTFVLRPHQDTQLPELPGGPNNRLLANRVLRIRKLLQYVAEKIELDPLPSVDDLELLCGDTVLIPTMTLASVKQYILKSSGDVILSYRYKEPTKANSLAPTTPILDSK